MTTRLAPPPYRCPLWATLTLMVGAAAGRADAQPVCPNPLALIDELAECRSIGWVGAHPDDEIFVTPLLAELCLEPGPDGWLRRCHLTTMTTGENGPCQPAGSEACAGPAAVAATRAAEHRRAAALLNASLTHYDYPDWKNAPSWVEAVLAWAALAPGESVEGLALQVMADLLEAEVDCLLLFDYRHGSTCHDEHRAASLLGLTAGLWAGIPPEDIFVTEAHYLPYLGGPPFQWYGYQGPPLAQPDPCIEDYDATGTPPWLTQETWQYLPDLVSIYSSQFGSQIVTSLRNAADPDKIVPMMRHLNVDPDDPAYQGICP